MVQILLLIDLGIKPAIVPWQNPDNWCGFCRGFITDFGADFKCERTLRVTEIAEQAVLGSFSSAHRSQWRGPSTTTTTVLPLKYWDNTDPQSTVC